jgi:hypothetical protein
VKLEFSRHIFEKVFKYEISSTSVQWEQTDGRTGIKLILVFHNFANAPKNGGENLNSGYRLALLIVWAWVAQSVQ